jgi:hypothetical protein
MTYYAIVDPDTREPFNVLIVTDDHRILTYNRQTKLWWASPNGPAYLMGTASNDIEPAARAEVERIAQAMRADLDDI